MSRFHDHAVHVHGTQNSKPTIVLGHGIGGHQGHWDPLVRHFERTHLVVTFAISGSFEAHPSIFSPVRHSSLIGFADDLGLLCAEMGIRNAIYVGHSLSGMVGGIASMADPGLFSRLVMLNASPCYIGDEGVGYVGAFTQQQVDDLLLAMAGDFEAWSSGFARVAMGNADHPELASEFARSLAAYDPGVTLTMFRAAFLSDFRKIVPRVTVPTLVLQSQADPAVPVEASQWLASHLTNGQMQLLSSTGHFPHVVNPEEVISAVEAFISGS